MKNPLVEQILSETPEDVRIFVELYADIVVRIHEILEEKGISQKTLAEKMGKTAPEISRWLAGNHNFTLRSLAKLQAELGEPLLYVPHRVQFQSGVQKRVSARVLRSVYKKSKGDFNDDYVVAEQPHYYGKQLA